MSGSTRDKISSVRGGIQHLSVSVIMPLLPVHWRRHRRRRSRRLRTNGDPPVLRHSEGELLPHTSDLSRPHARHHKSLQLFDSFLCVFGSSLGSLDGDLRAGRRTSEVLRVSTLGAKAARGSLQTLTEFMGSLPTDQPSIRNETATAKQSSHLHR